MYSPMPVFSYNKEPHRKTARDGVSVAPETRGRRSTASSPTPPVHHLHNSIDDLLEPAIEGPPSPERIRAFSHHMKRDSSADRHQSELISSSGSSSRLSGTSDRPSWNQSLESLSLSTNPSQRSTSSGAPSRDRPDSVQFFGKGIFNRSMVNLRRKSHDHNSSNSSLDTSEMPIDAMPAPKEQSSISSMFTRRRALRGESSAPAQKKLQISGPYNFQHLTHTRKDSVPDLDRTNRMELVSEFSSIRPRRPTDASLYSVVAPDEPQFHGSNSETFFHQEDPSVGLNANVARSRNIELPSLPPPPPPPPMRYARRSQSQDKIRVAPPRPPRSPIEDSFVPPIAPPPRTSSRISVRHNRFDSLSGSLAERPATVTGFRKPEPFAPISPKTKTLREPPTAPRVEPVIESIQEQAAAPLNFGHAITTPDDVAWPLSNSITSLPDVPEEEEHHAVSRPSRTSVASNHSSLRGSISVPLLRQFSMTRSPERSLSNASDTLGFFSAQRQGRAGEDNLADDAARDNWEDDIDYCYEHEAEADCDYAWERPSCDIVRGSEISGCRTMGGGQTQSIVTFGGLSRGLLSPESADVPALSPASQTSNGEKQEALTPTNLPVTSNFSLPRRESSAMLLRVHKPTQSIETSFKESQGFSLSPSLLIPNDYHQQMLQYEREDLEESDDEDFLIQSNAVDEPIITFSKTLAPSNARSSASTTDSAFSEHSLASSRHKSTTSTSTAYTRWTGSSTSSWTARDSSQPVPPKPVVENTSHPVIAAPTKVAMIPQFDEEIVVKQDLSRDKHSRTQSHADLLMRSNYNTTPPAEPKPAKEPIKNRRRARTTSRSHASPQFALFPSVTTATYGGRV
ncbi:hypothetical protein F5Y05DRAFT_407513 [Hypoxylon sp. FL0543]|nr:hypothetical protein F5Y05DRAFT_407513 [Hypoxylon sp. FL0543]